MDALMIDEWKDVPVFVTEDIDGEPWELECFWKENRMFRRWKTSVGIFSGEFSDTVQGYLLSIINGDPYFQKTLEEFTKFFIGENQEGLLKLTGVMYGTGKEYGQIKETGERGNYTVMLLGGGVQHGDTPFKPFHLDALEQMSIATKLSTLPVLFEGVNPDLKSLGSSLRIQRTDTQEVKIWHP